MNDCKLPLIPVRLQRLHGWMECEPPIEIDAAVGFARLRHRQSGPQIEIGLFKEWRDDVQPIGGAALKYRDYDFLAAAAVRTLLCGPNQPGRSEANSREGDCR